jgi:hypothetical protein
MMVYASWPRGRNKGMTREELKGRWLFMALLAVAIVALAGCAGAALSEPCGGFYACTSWH